MEAIFYHVYIYNISYIVHVNKMKSLAQIWIRVNIFYLGLVGLGLGER